MWLDANVRPWFHWDEKPTLPLDKGIYGTDAEAFSGYVAFNKCVPS